MATQKKTSKPKAAAPATEAWRALERKLGNHGTYPAKLEPRDGGAYKAFDPKPLLPAEYNAFIRELGYPWVSGNGSRFGFLPPQWIQAESMRLGVTGRKWDDVRTERKANKHRYAYVMFASHDLNDSNGYAFGRDDDGEVVVWNVEDSLAESPLGTFTDWLRATIADLAKGNPNVEEEEDVDSDALSLVASSLPIASAKKKSTKKTKQPESVLAAFDRDETEIDLSERKLRALPAEIGEFTVLERLDLSGAELTSLPPEIGKLRALTSLDLSYSDLVTLPPEIGELASLTELTLNHCYALTSLPTELGKLKNLTWLDVSSCAKLAALPIELGKLKKLTTIAISRPRDTPKPANTTELQKLLPKCEFR